MFTFIDFVQLIEIRNKILLRAPAPFKKQGSPLKQKSWSMDYSLRPQPFVVSKLYMLDSGLFLVLQFEETLTFLIKRASMALFSSLALPTHAKTRNHKRSERFVITSAITKRS